MIKLLTVLYKMNLLTFRGIVQLFNAILKNGINVMILLDIAEKKSSNQIAVVYEDETITYRQLLSQSEKLSSLLHNEFRINEEQKVGLLCKNHLALVKSIFAISRLGADIYLLNAEMGKIQFNELVDQHNFDF